MPPPASVLPAGHGTVTPVCDAAMFGTGALTVRTSTERSANAGDTPTASDATRIATATAVARLVRGDPDLDAACGMFLCGCCVEDERVGAARPGAGGQGQRELPRLLAGRARPRGDRRAAALQRHLHRARQA